MAEEAVRPNFSPQDSLLTGNNTGNFADPGSISRVVFRHELHSMEVVHREA
jgi:hypothetical protein